MDILCKLGKDPENRPIIEEFIPEILALCEKFGNSGQSGGSASYVATALSQGIKKLCLQEPICPITGISEEWNNVSRIDNKTTLYQNNRCSALFLVDDDNQCGAYYLDAIVWKTEKGTMWSGTALDKDGNKVYSRQYVKKFPFTPKTFYVDVIEKEVNKDDWEFYIKDDKQLKRVFKYYKRYGEEI